MASPTIPRLRFRRLQLVRELDAVNERLAEEIRRIDDRRNRLRSESDDLIRHGEPTCSVLQSQLMRVAPQSVIDAMFVKGCKEFFALRFRELASHLHNEFLEAAEIAKKSKSVEAEAGYREAARKFGLAGSEASSELNKLRAEQDQLRQQAIE